MTYSVLYEIRIVLWVLLILFLGTTGYCIYGTIEDDKNLGYYIGGLLTSTVLVCVIIYLIVKGNQEQANIIKEKNRLELEKESVPEPSVPEPSVPEPSVPEPRVTEPRVTEPRVTEPTPEIFTPEIKSEAKKMLESTEGEYFDIDDYNPSSETYQLQAFYLELCYRFNLLGYKFPNYKLQIHICRDEDKFEENKRIFDSEDIKTYFEELNLPQLYEPDGKPSGEWFSDFYTAESKDGYSDNWIHVRIREMWHVDPRFCQCMVVSRFNNDTTFTLTPENVPIFKRYLTESDLDWYRFVTETGYSGIQIPDIYVGNIESRTSSGRNSTFFEAHGYDAASYVAWNRKAFEEVIIFKRETYQDLLDKYFPQ